MEQSSPDAQPGSQSYPWQVAQLTPEQIQLANAIY